MKRLLVLGAANRTSNWIERLLGRLDPKPNFLDETSCAVDCDGLLVVDDGGDNGFEAVRNALAIRESRPGLPIAVVTTLDSNWSDSECLTRTRCRSASQTDGSSMKTSVANLQQLLAAHDAQVGVRIEPDAITFEYHE